MRPPFFVLALALYPQRTLSTDEFTFSCLPLTIQRSDPIMAPGRLSSHTHVVVGGTAFQRRMTADTARSAKGTTCGVAIDRSNYWAPQLYHQTGRGSPADEQSIYYFNRACNYTAHKTACPKERAIAPPAGLRMMAGDSSRRTYDASRFDQRAISHMCIHADGGSSETKAFPPRRCAKLRSQVFMPSCWDGQHLDSADHADDVKMAYPAIGDYNKGICPPSHPVAISSIFLEFIYDTSRYPEYRNWVYSNGDATGFGLHGDFIHGWTDQPALEKAAATCTGPKGLSDPRCSITKTQKAIAPARHQPEVAAPGDEVGQHGPLQRLPGDNPMG
ncbi:hypothetical protein BO80DRAFT_444545 [Aspergillus terreus]|uniref:Uncharacterized protein n=1 Tax=Aspergillus terreus TaxID=33178 RepID=A0A5M3ZI13_ASPTE|nr:hypothetical protein ATETN484_0017014500 [Aspergillus terreus]GFF21816.1 hypothetical protein BO80DRAFT_444545 [Aspergillus terreus]